MQLGVAAQKAGLKLFGDAQQVVDDQHLPVHVGAGADADGGNTQLLGHLFGQRGGNFFQHQREAAQVLELLRVFEQFLGLGVFFGTHGVGAELVDALRREAQVAHHRDAGRENTLDAFPDFGAAFQLHGVGAAFLHDANGRAQRLARRALIRAKRHIHDHQRPLHGPHHGLRVVYHLVQGDGQRGFVAGHHVRGGVADEQHVDAGPVEDAGHREVVGREHRDSLAPAFHGQQLMGGNELNFFVLRHEMEAEERAGQM